MAKHAACNVSLLQEVAASSLQLKCLPTSQGLLRALTCPGVNFSTPFPLDLLLALMSCFGHNIGAPQPGHPGSLAPTPGKAATAPPTWPLPPFPSSLLRDCDPHFAATATAVAQITAAMFLQGVGCVSQARGAAPGAVGGGAPEGAKGSAAAPGVLQAFAQVRGVVQDIGYEELKDLWYAASPRRTTRLRQGRAALMGSTVLVHVEPATAFLWPPFPSCVCV
eukprot:scaffold100518_cov17-Tisochrysis_lutea.AAC.2